MVRPRSKSGASEDLPGAAGNQELGSMYDYLAKIILLGPSGSGKSCLLHRFVKNEWRVLSSQTIGVEFASKIIKVGTGSRRKRIKFQLWDTAGTERFRSVSRSYYRGAAGALLVYDLSSYRAFTSLSSFMNDARALASPNLTIILVGNKLDLADQDNLIDIGSDNTPSNKIDIAGTSESSNPPQMAVGSTGSNLGIDAPWTVSAAPDGREVTTDEASKWASANGITASVEVSAMNGQNVDEVFHRLARVILTKIELGEINPDDPMSGIQYGDSGWYVDGDGSSVKSGMTVPEGSSRRRQRKPWSTSGMREWEDVFRLKGSGRRSKGCC
ncbi:GTP-binding protein ypt4 [Golovinomyces cichoracearum]|uniref:GTP-binding protein ypt4 n=1 Tax=Golovinomyces cichoracearum TaxID=62708 RepID=A0A420ISF8_9PEZI|nr:GTP-binding protein ypt4 [Golovinomyces cichoracearum]